MHNGLSIPERIMSKYSTRIVVICGKESKKARVQIAVIWSRDLFFCFMRVEREGLALDI